MQKDYYPLVSCKTITYGRINTLEETLYSFLQQRYKNKELIIVNDYPLQILIFEHPQVKIFNLSKTFTTIGDKENFAVEQCEGELIAVFDDDDVALPIHLDNVIKYWKEGTTLLHWSNAAFYNEPIITSLTGVGNSGIVYSKKIWEELRHPIMNAGGDSTFVNSIHAKGRENVVFATPPDEEIGWFYMWGGRGYHQSGMGYDVEGKPNIIERHSLYIEGERKKGNIPTGIIELKPHWKKNYSQMLKDYINTLKK